MESESPACSVGDLACGEHALQRPADAVYLDDLWVMSAAVQDPLGKLDVLQVPSGKWRDIWEDCNKKAEPQCYSAILW